MAEEGANFVGGFRGEDVLKLAGLLLDFRFTVHGQAVGKKALGKAMAADDAACAFAATRCEFDNEGSVAGGCCYWFERFVTGIDERAMIVRFGRMRCRDNHAHVDHLFDCQADWKRAVNLHTLDFCDFSVFGENPELFENLVEYDVDGVLRPQLAKALPEISPDKLVYTFDLRDDVVFQNGQPMTADDVKYSFETLLWGQLPR